MDNIGKFLFHAAAVDPERIAVVFGNGERSYADVAHSALALGGALAARGVGRGDRVALWTPNCAEFLELIFGIPAIGAIAVPLDFWWTADDAMLAIAQARPKVIIAAPAQARSLLEREVSLRELGVTAVVTLDEDCSGEGLSYRSFLADAVPLPAPVVIEESDPALVLFTSGSTGRSKGAVHTHRDIWLSSAIICLELGIREGERTLHFLPLFSSCLEHLIPLTMMRATHVVMPSFDADAAWLAIERHGVTYFDSVPTTLRRMLDRMPEAVPSSLRLICYASEMMPASLIEELIRRLPATQFVQIYGMIEHLCLTVHEPGQQLSKIGTVGRPMMGTALRIVDHDGAICATGEVGEIEARSATLFSGYWQDPATTGQVLRDGWMRTGDLGYLDEDGFLVLAGRTKQIIKTGGVTVIPTDVEAIILRHDAVREVAVVGIPDDVWGEAVHAFVVLKDGHDLPSEDLRAFCRTQAVGYKTPKVVHVVTDLPRTGIGKISRRHVREHFLAGRQAAATA